MKTPGHSLSHKLTCHKQDVWNTSNLLTSCCYLPPCYVRFCSNNHCAAADTWYSKHRARPNPIDWPIVIDVQSSFLSHCPTTIQFNYWISACLMFPILNLLLLHNNVNISNSATSFFEWTSCAFVFLNCFFKSLTVYVHFHDLYTSRDRLNTFDTLSHCRCENGRMLFLIISIQYSYIFIFQLFSWIFSAALFFIPHRVWKS